MKQQMRENFYQWSLIVLLTTVTLCFGVFVYREIFPEYKLYQNNYLVLEELRAEVNHSEMPPFKGGVKQIVLPQDNNGPETIDRCISCHVALELPHFSPTQAALDVNGEVIVDNKGHPIQEPNPNYIWKIVEDQIASLTNENELAELRKQGKESEVTARLKKAKTYQAMKKVRVGHFEYDMTKVLAAHPLIGREAYPFQFHPMEEYGCTGCHNGNGRGLITDKAHGPVYDGQYEKSNEGPVPKFIESDPLNDPPFARVFNGKPGHDILFQTTPLYVGRLMEAKCVLCHQQTHMQLDEASAALALVNKNKEDQIKIINEGIQNSLSAIQVLMQAKRTIQANGYQDLVKEWSAQMSNPRLTDAEQKQMASRVNYFTKVIDRVSAQTSDEKEKNTLILKVIDRDLKELLGSDQLVTQLDLVKTDRAAIKKFLEEHQSELKGSLRAKQVSIAQYENFKQRLLDMHAGLEENIQSPLLEKEIRSDSDDLIESYHRGQELFVSQGCYACHRIAGFSHGGVGLELTKIGLTYPWFIKEAIVWPQSIKASIMPNFKLDPEDLEVIMTFLLGQTGKSKAVSSIQEQIKVKNWDAGQKTSWEKPISPEKIHDVHGSMLTFATEGCAACHKLKGFESNVGYAVEKNNPSFEELMTQRDWFQKMIPEEMLGSLIVQAIDAHADEIDKKILPDVRQQGIIEEIDQAQPGLVEAFYTNFKYASRAKNHHYAELVKKDPDNREQYLAELAQWKERVHRVLMIYIQEYGLGRLIAPRLNWSGIFRTDHWLIEHFRNPSLMTAKSIMPAINFDDTKFYALTYMLNELAKRNRDEVRKIWDHRGFNPEMAYHIHCSNCHGNYMEGDGPTAQWIYPIPKNLRNATFMRNLTKERTIESISHGIKGTPMPNWGEYATDKGNASGGPILRPDEIKQLVDWLFLALPGAEVIKGSNVPKWQYTPEDVLEEMKKEGSPLQGNQSESPHSALWSFPKGDHLYAAMNPIVSVKKSPSKDDLAVSDIFDVLPLAFSDEEKPAYFIKKKYYTKENLLAGESFFQLNCAACHGKEAAGNGERAEIMTEAKPRMLTNLNWLKSQDDLRLLQSIKYGVPGTAMTPWGDLTTSKQRLQLVMFIRQLSHSSELRLELKEAIFRSFEYAITQIEDQRAYHYADVDKLRQQLEKAQKDRETLYEKIEEGESSQSPIDAYKTELQLVAQLKKLEETDALLFSIIEQVKAEKEVYYIIGASFVDKEVDEPLVLAFLELIRGNEGRYVRQKNQLEFDSSSEKLKKIDELENSITLSLNKRLEDLEKRELVLKNQSSSEDRDAELTWVREEIKGLTHARNIMLSGLETASNLRKKQSELFEVYKKEI